MPGLKERFVVAAVFALVASGVVAPNANSQPLDRPRLDAGRVTGEVLVGAYAGIGGVLLGRRVGHEIASFAGAESEATIRRAQFVGAAAGGIFATSGAIFGIGSIGDQTGDFSDTALGTTAGFVVAVGVARLMLGPDLRPEPGSSTAMRWTMANVLALLPAIGGTIAFNSSRRSQ
jgi:hypothetical protein